jgi:hypothetical protein
LLFDNKGRARSAINEVIRFAHEAASLTHHCGCFFGIWGVKKMMFLSIFRLKNITSRPKSLMDNNRWLDHLCLHLDFGGCFALILEIVMF